MWNPRLETFPCWCERKDGETSHICLKSLKRPQLILVIVIFFIGYSYLSPFFYFFNSLLYCFFLYIYIFSSRVFMSINKYGSFFPSTFYSTFFYTKQPKQSPHFLFFFFPRMIFPYTFFDDPNKALVLQNSHYKMQIGTKSE